MPAPRLEEEALVAPRKGAIAAMLLLALVFGAPQLFGATSAKPKHVPAPTASVPFATQSFHLDMIKDDAMLLVKPGSAATVQFVLPDTQLVRAGDLRLRYLLPDQEAKSDAPIAEVRLNDVLLGSITPTASEYAAGAGEVDFPVPGEVLVRKNLLTVQLAGNGTPGCMRNAQPVVPMRLAPSSQMSFEAQPLHLASDLRALPHPFLEHIALAPSVIPFVFEKQPSSAVLQAAGVLASWFGTQESDTPKHFPITYGALPKGNAVVFLSGSESLPGVPAGEGKRTVAIIDNPADPFGKLLVLRAENEEMLLEAAQTFSLTQKQLVGEIATLPDATLPPVRSINDAPRWVHNDRTSLSQLMTETERHTTDANPFNLYMHLSPDYNFGAQQRMYVHVKYSTDARVLAPSSNITARFNGQTVDSYPLETGRVAKVVDVPIVEIPAAIYANTLQLQFFFNNPGSPCAPRRTSNNARLLGNSYIDLGGAVHQASMPNLKLFAKAGFPFTRRADLSDTAVLLPEAPSPEVITLYLDLLSYFGEQTGYPASRVEVGTLAEADQYTAKDQLVLGTFDDLSSAPKLMARLPLTVEEGGLRFTLLGRMGFLRKALSSLRWTLVQEMQDTSSHDVDGLVAGYESPFSSGRSTVFALAARNEQIPALNSAMIQAMPGDSIDSSVTLWQDGSFRSYPLYTPTYYVGTLPWRSSIRYSLSENPALLLLAVLALCLLLSLWIAHWLQFRIRRRLHLLHQPLSIATADPLHP